MVSRMSASAPPVEKFPTRIDYNAFDKPHTLIRVRHFLEYDTENEVAAAIQGQGELATMSYDELRSRLFADLEPNRKLR